MSKARKAVKGKQDVQLQHGSGEPHQQADLLKRALQWFFKGDNFQDLQLHGNVQWRPDSLIMLIVVWTWSDLSTLTGAFQQALELTREMFGSVAIGTYQGMLAALRKYSPELLHQWWSLLHQRMEGVAGKHWRIGLWLAIAIDGSRVSTPRTRSNEQAFAAQNYGGSRTARS